jgi:hypothetical protein
MDAEAAAPEAAPPPLLAFGALLPERLVAARMADDILPPEAAEPVPPVELEEPSVVFPPLLAETC